MNEGSRLIWSIGNPAGGGGGWWPHLPVLGMPASNCMAPFFFWTDAATDLVLKTLRVHYYRHVSVLLLKQTWLKILCWKSVCRSHLWALTSPGENPAKSDTGHFLLLLPQFLCICQKSDQRSRFLQRYIFMQYNYLSQQNKGCTTYQSSEECSAFQLERQCWYQRGGVGSLLWVLS